MWCWLSWGLANPQAKEVASHDHNHHSAGRAGSCSASSATPTALSTQKASAIQFADGRIDDGSVHEAPHVYLGDDALTSAQARELARADRDSRRG